MKTIRNSVLIGLAVLGMGSAPFAAQAQEAPVGRHGHAVNQAQMQAKMTDMFAKHQAKLHDLLKLTAAQEPAWTTYQAAIKPAAPAAHDRAAFAAMPAPERLGKMIEMGKQHVASMEAHLTALNAFYATLTPEQKAVFDANTMGGAHGPHHRGMMHHG